MPAEFDPYWKWLSIPPAEQPPNHYRLLGVAKYESDPDVIENAADRQMSHVRRFQTGERAPLTQELLNQLSAARVCLLNRQSKQRYDEVLRNSEPAKPPVSPPSPASPRHSASAVPIPPAPPPPPPSPTPPPVGGSTLRELDAPEQAESTLDIRTRYGSAAGRIRPARRLKRSPWPLIVVLVGILVLLVVVAFQLKPS